MSWVLSTDRESTRTPDNPHKCLIPKFPETPHFCPDKIFEIWAFLSEMSPDLPAGRPICPNMDPTRTPGICHGPDLNRRLSQLPKISTQQVALSEHGPDLNFSGELLVRTWTRPTSAKLAILSGRPLTSGTKMTQICPTWHQTLMGIIRGPA